MSVDIGERIRSLRTARGVSQEEVARRTGIGLKSYGDLERGRTKDPHYSTLRGVARALGVRVEELLQEPAVPLDQDPGAGRIGKEIEEIEVAPWPEEDPQQWEWVLASVRGRQREVEAMVEELVALPDPSKADLYQVKWALDEARDCQDALLLALPGTHRQHSRGRDEIVIDPVAVDVDQWQKWLNAKRFYDNIVERLVEAGLVELRERIGQRAEPVPVGIGA